MSNKLKKIKIDKSIISVNNFDTFPNEFKKLIQVESDTIKKYKSYLREKERLATINNPYESIHAIRTLENNNTEILESFNDLVNKCIVLLNDYYFVVYHLGRFTKDEIFNIKHNGMFLPTKELLINKIRNLKLCENDETKLISHINNLLSLQAEQCIYLKLGNYNINNDFRKCDMKKFLQHWGGETIYNAFEINSEFKYLDKYLIEMSTPQIILSKIQLRNIPDRENIVEKITLTIPSLDKFDETIIVYRDDVVKVIDAINFELDEKIQIEY